MNIGNCDILSYLWTENSCKKIKNKKSWSVKQWVRAVGLGRGVWVILFEFFWYMCGVKKYVEVCVELFKM